MNSQMNVQKSTLTSSPKSTLTSSQKIKQPIIIDDGFEKSTFNILTEIKKDKETSFTTVYSKYVHSTVSKHMLSTHDIVSKEFKILRAHYASINKDRSIIEETPKTVNGFNLNCPDLEDPLSKFEKPSEVQLKMIEQVNKLPFKGSFCLNAACGSGKTVAGLSIIKRLNCKTLIVSARNAVNDQWKTEIRKYFPNLKIVDDKLPKNENRQSDIYIFTPQYLMHHINKEDLKYLKVDLIIYDELHSLLSNKFSKTLSLGMFMKLNKLYERLPYMVGLTATIPQKTTKHYHKIVKIFGLPIKTNDVIRNIPIKYLDVRQVFPKSCRGSFDENYNPINDFTAIDVLTEFVLKNKNKSFITRYNSITNSKSVVKKLDNIKNISDFDFSDRITIQNKFLIVTGSIPSSVYGFLVACKKFKTNVLLIRSSSEKDIYLEFKDLEDSNYEFDTSITLQKLQLDIKSGSLNAKFCYYQEYIDRTTIIVGTYHRLLEGFNCPDITDGICTKFIYSPLSRVQLLGRIRRSRSSDKEHPMIRQFIVNSGRISSNLKMPRRIGPIKITYEQDFENSLFQLENYNNSVNMFDKIAIRKIVNAILGKDFKLVNVPKKYSDEFYLNSYELIHDLLNIDDHSSLHENDKEQVEKYKLYLEREFKH